MRVVSVRRPLIRDDPGSTSTVATTTTTVSGTSSSVPPRATTTTTSQAAPEVDLADSLGSNSFALDGFSFHSRKDNSDESETEEFRGDDDDDDDDEDASLDGMTTIDVVTGDSVGKRAEGDGYFEDEEDSGKGPSPVGDVGEGDGGRPGEGGSPSDTDVNLKPEKENELNVRRPSRPATPPGEDFARKRRNFFQKNKKTTFVDFDSDEEDEGRDRAKSESDPDQGRRKSTVNFSAKVGCAGEDGGEPEKPRRDENGRRDTCRQVSALWARTAKSTD